jgi:plasmid stability protein
MSITIHLPPAAEDRLRQRAAECGVAPDALARQLLEQALNGGETVPAGCPAPALEQVLAPFRKEVEESGLTDDELRQFFTEVRDEVRAEKRDTSAPGRAAP